MMVSAGTNDVMLGGVSHTPMYDTDKSPFMTWGSRFGLGAMHAYGGTGIYPWESISGRSFASYGLTQFLHREFDLTPRMQAELYRTYRNFVWRWTVTYPYKWKFLYKRHYSNAWRYKLKWLRRVDRVRTWWWRDVRKELLLKQREVE